MLVIRILMPSHPPPFGKLERFPMAHSRLLPGLVLGLGLSLLVVSSVAHARRVAIPMEDLTEAVRVQVEALPSPGGNTKSAKNAKWDTASPAALVREFYEAGAYRPAWSDGRRLGKPAEELLKRLERAAEWGLDPADYPLDRIRYLEKEESDARGIAELDLRLTESFFRFGSHLLNGRIPPDRVEREWSGEARVADLPAALESAVARGRV